MDFKPDVETATEVEITFERPVAEFHWLRLAPWFVGSGAVTCTLLVCGVRFVQHLLALMMGGS